MWMMVIVWILGVMGKIEDGSICLFSESRFLYLELWL